MLHFLIPAKKSTRLACLFITLFALCSTFVFAIFWLSLSQKEGKRRLRGLQTEVFVDRDKRSIPHIKAKSRTDLCRALGFVHAQDRFFQMDALRRVSSGELSELFGSSTLFIDQRMRPFHLREVAQKIVSQLPPKESDWLTAYTAGVNEGLRALKCSPFEYWLLRGRVEPWRPEDTFLVCYNLFSALQDFRGELTKHRETLYANLPREVAHFFTENGSIWEARIDDSRDELLPIPDKEHFAYLASSRNRQAQPSTQTIARAAPRISDPMGSNCWALTKDLTKGKGAMIACDMHLRLGVPNIWYRTSMSFIDEDEQSIDLHGATIPGVPALIMGSNGHIGWGFTNAQLNTTDLMRIERIGEDHYQSPQGPLPLKRRQEVIKVRGSKDVVQHQLHTHLGPLVSAGDEKGDYAMHWIGLDHRALDLSLMALEGAKDAGEAVKIATAMRAPALNFLVADDRGQIGWALSGSVPKRDYSARRAIDLDKGGWQTMMASKEMPQQILSREGRLWNANHTMLSAKKWGYLGCENMLNPIRGYQIKSDLFSRSSHTFDEMRDLQFEVRAPFFGRWQNLLTKLLKQTIENEQTTLRDGGSLSPERFAQLQKREALLNACHSWDGRCQDRSTGYCLIRRFRNQVIAHVLSRFLAPCFAADPSFSPHCFECEESVWTLVSQRPCDLADPAIGTWDDELLKILDEVIAHFSLKYPNQPLHEITWGDEQILKIEHPLSKAVKWLSKIIDLPSSHLGGDKWVPKVLCETFGASQRMILYPENQAMSSFEMPGGQSGNPLSKHYRDLHKSWTEGAAEPLLPAETVNRLYFVPDTSDR